MSAMLVKKIQGAVFVMFALAFVWVCVCLFWAFGDGVFHVSSASSMANVAVPSASPLRQAMVVCERLPALENESPILREQREDCAFQAESEELFRYWSQNPTAGVVLDPIEE